MDSVAKKTRSPMISIGRAFGVKHGTEQKLMYRLALASDRIVEMLEDLVTTVARIEAHFVLAHLVLVIAFRRPVINKNVVEREEGNEVAFTSVGVDVQSHERIHRFFRKAPDELHVSA